MLDRAGWVEANVTSMQHMLAPLTEKLGERLAQSPIAPVGRQGRRRRGRFAARLPRATRARSVRPARARAEPAPTTATPSTTSAPTSLALEKRFAFRPLDFRRWIAIHEVTHRAQFTGVPWMRDYFLSLVQGSLSIVDPDPTVLLRAIGRAADALRAGRNPLDDGGLVGLFASPQQQEYLGRVQALMSLLEGHGNYVMNELGQRHVNGAERMARVLHSAASNAASAASSRSSSASR